jgi:hypothetical protein
MHPATHPPTEFSVEANTIFQNGVEWEISPPRIRTSKLPGPKIPAANSQYPPNLTKVRVSAIGRMISSRKSSHESLENLLLCNSKGCFQRSNEALLHGTPKNETF